MSEDANYWLGRMIATLKQTVRESDERHPDALRTLRQWAESDLCSEAEASEIILFLATQHVTAGGMA